MAGTNDYYDIDAILTDHQKIPSTFNFEIPGLGYLESPTDPNQPLLAGTKLDLPLWLSELLAIQQFTDLHLPPPFSSRVRNALKADPKSVDLRAWSPHFYGVGVRLLGVVRDEELVQVLEATWRERVAVVADHAQNPTGAMEEGAVFLSGLDEMERQLFRIVHDSAKAMKQWQDQGKKSS
ncbi:GINS complex subunit Psf3 [Saitoella complicata NRRL Y-17804]|uniref:DNA replication complex GINS protein PSF3 n=1 Tax=Saitoella complicata (strain BCRC 22490 / CBS 7301 / JCM 7358 / NBRC 10748 / NRRL Y-17804) TaxID=698492 RepID=A0A0E9NME2_SAICN|nr:GINS complex subunit Psf3 [Saitoella complicata NRRL Y-17804]ODQ53499.1 GINS complex subunit Psf3 [Saitoella complicata NRRL Y-17804]GAO51047.1 hypothetical protein G7K_5159-t1 [Saitoella complicata NRRL Y-17804]